MSVTTSKKVLFVTTSRPTEGSGTGERSLGILRAIARVAEPYVLVLDHREHAPLPADTADTTTVPLYHGAAQSTWFWRRRKYTLGDYRVDPLLLDTVRRLDQRHRFDAYFCRYFTSTVAGCDRLGPALLDFDDVPHVMPGPRLPGWRPLGWRVTAQRLRTFRTVLVTKQADRLRLPHPDVRVLPCISTRLPQADPLPGSQPGAEGAPRLLFVGSVRWGPNRDGLQRFIERSLPAVRRAVPGLVLRAVGEDTDRLPPAPGLTGAGYVDDIAAEYAAADVVIVPIQAGDGANIKLAEAARFGKAIVASGHAARGFAGILEPGLDLLAGESDAELAALCVRLLNNRPERDALGRHAQVAAERDLSQQAIDRIVGGALTDTWLRAPASARTA